MSQKRGQKMEDFHIQWHITNLCNLRCIHCYQEHFGPQEELNLENLLRISDNLIRTMKTWNTYLFLYLTGGEPLVKPELWSLIDYLKGQERIKELSLITNGVLIDLYIDKILKYSLKKIFISLDGISCATNDYIRGKGTFNKVLENVKILKSKGVKVFIMYTLMNFNYEEAKGLISFCRSLSLDGFILERFFPLGKGKEISGELVSGENLFGLYKEICNQCGVEFEKKEIVSIRALKVTLEKIPSLYTAQCVVGRYGLAVLPDGSVFPCRRFNFKIGNLLRQNLDNLWENSLILNQIRKKENLKGKCARCEIKDCIGCRAMVYALTGDYLEEDPHCFL